MLFILAENGFFTVPAKSKENLRRWVFYGTFGVKISLHISRDELVLAQARWNVRLSLLFIFFLTF
jgi:hypothetical protein